MDGDAFVPARHVGDRPEAAQGDPRPDRRLRPAVPLRPYRLPGHGDRQRGDRRGHPGARGPRRQRDQLARGPGHRGEDRRPGRDPGGLRRRPVPRPAVVLGAHRRGTHPRPAHPGVRPRAADAAGVLHPHPDRRADQPAQQRRDRRPAGVHLDAVRCRLQRDRAGPHRRRDVLAVLADHRALADPAAGLRAPGPPDRSAAAGDHPGVVRAERLDERDDDRAVQRVRCAAGQAVRPAGGGVPLVRRAGRLGCATSASCRPCTRGPSSSR